MTKARTLAQLNAHELKGICRMLLLNLPNDFRRERAWICDVILGEFFGQSLRMHFSAVEMPEIAVEGARGTLRLSDRFFRGARDQWLKPGSMPPARLAEIDRDSLSRLCPDIELPLPEIFGDLREEKEVFRRQGDEAVLALDVLGAAFFMLSRYEELVVTERDEHDRFSARASVAYKAGFLERPIIDEYVELLWAAMKALWPRLERKCHEARVLPSHDIDHPSCYWGRSLLGKARFAAKSLIARDPLSAFKSVTECVAYPHLGWKTDPYDCIDWMMDVSEAHGRRSAFYYIPQKTSRLDPGMPLDHPQVEAQWKRIAARGHEIGIHPGYNTYDKPEAIRCGAELIRRRLSSLGINQKLEGGRQHYLRWRTPDTARAWAESGLSYDSTLGYADHAGFRCGTAREYKMFDLHVGMPIELRQRPLIVMECSVVGARYQNKGYSEASLDYMKKLKERALKFGNFTLLWHNSHFESRLDAEFFKTLVS